jgi:glycosyltransferase involved in cell wall biosynthesis
MKIVHVLNHFLPDQIAGTEIYVVSLCRELNLINHKAIVLIPNFGKTENEEYFYDNIRVIKYAEPTIQDRSLILGHKQPEGLISFLRILEFEKPDWIHFHEYAVGNGITLDHILSAKNNGFKTIMTFHLANYTCRTGTLIYNQKLCDGKIDKHKCSKCYLINRGHYRLSNILLLLSKLSEKFKIDPSKWNNKVGTAISTTLLLRKFKNDFQLLYLHLDHLIPITKWYYNQLLINGVPKNKITLIEQGLPYWENRKEKSLVYNRNHIKLIFIGRLTSQKGLHLLIEALMSMPKGVFQLSIYGQSSDLVYENSLRNKTQKFNNISWNGRLDPKDVIPILEQHDLLCLCSTFSEMSPLVIQEAFEAGIPVLASHVYGNIEHVTHGRNGLLFKFNNVNSLREQLQSFIDDPSLLTRMRSNLQKPNLFSRVAFAYHQLYIKSLADS